MLTIYVTKGNWKWKQRQTKGTKTETNVHSRHYRYQLTSVVWKRKTCAINGKNINFPLTASNRELCHDSFQYSTKKRENPEGTANVDFVTLIVQSYFDNLLSYVSSVTFCWAAFSIQPIETVLSHLRVAVVKFQYPCVNGLTTFLLF